MKYIGSSTTWSILIPALVSVLVQKIYSDYFNWPKHILAFICTFLFLVMLSGVMIVIIPMIFKARCSLISNIFKQKK